jgi:heme A synthase
MINAIFHAHSGLRYLVLLAAVVALIVTALGTFGRKPYERPSRISMAAFTGLLDLQILLGIVMVVLGCFYPALMGHLMMMILAAAAAHGCSVYARKQADGRRAHTVALVGVVLALVLIVGGISAIGRSPVGSSGNATCTAAHS